MNITHFSIAAMGTADALLARLPVETQEKIADATEHGASLELVHVYSTSGPALRLDLIDVAGGRHTLASLSGGVTPVQ